MRTNLKVFRIKKQMTQEEMADKIRCKRATYSAVENGSRSGKHDFWEGLKIAFDIPDKEMWDIMKNDN